MNVNSSAVAASSDAMPIQVGNTPSRNCGEVNGARCLNCNEPCCFNSNHSGIHSCAACSSPGPLPPGAATSDMSLFWNSLWLLQLLEIVFKLIEMKKLLASRKESELRDR